MYKQSLLWCLLLLAPFALRAQTDAASVRQVLNQQVTDWNKGDVTAFMTGYWRSDSVIFMTKTGPEYGYQPMLEHYKKGFPNKAAMGTLTFSNLILKRLSPDYYFVIGAFHLARSTGDAGGQFTLLFRKVNGQWKIAVDHTS
jgi:ketosteroid isomerase-like protein